MRLSLKTSKASWASWSGTRTGSMLLVLVALLLSVLILGPALSIISTAVFPGGSADLSHFISAVTQNGKFRTLADSLLLGAGVVIASTVISLPLSFIMVRTDISRHSWLKVLFLVPFMTPPYISSMGWILFMQKRGLLVQLFPWTAGADALFFSLGGMILVMSLNVFPFMMNILTNAMRNIGSDMDEAARIGGGSFLYRTRRILLPLLSGSYAVGCLLVFVKTLSEYGTPATLGKRIGFTVFTTDIHLSATMAPIDFPRAASLSIVLLVFCLIAWQIQRAVSRRTSYRILGRRAAPVIPARLSPAARAAAWTYIALVLLVAIGIPYFSIISTSLIKLRGYGLRWGNFTFNHYVALFTANPKGRAAILSSLGLAAAASVACIVAGTLIAVLIHTMKRKKMTVYVESLSLLPEMIPNIVMVLGLMLFWNSLYHIIPLYNTRAMLVMVYSIMFLPFTVQYVSAALSQMGSNLQDAARISGASSSYVLLHVTVPLVRPGIISGAVMTFIISFRELVASSLVSPPGVLTVSTFIMAEFDQGSVSVGMGMAVICVLLTTGVMLMIERFGVKKNTQVRA